MAKTIRRVMTVHDGYVESIGGAPVSNPALNQPGGFVETLTETLDSVELTLGAKGEYRHTIKVYFDSATQDAALARMDALDARLRDKYGVHD